MTSDRRRTRSAGQGQDPLFALKGTRRLEIAVDKAIRRAYQESVVDRALDAGMVTMARTLARAIDEAASAGGDRWLLARLTGELRETLIRLRLDPVSRGGERDDFATLYAALSQPTVGDAPQP